MSDLSDAAPVYTPTIAVNAAFMAIACVSVALRIYTRVAVVKILHWEDALMVVAVASFTVFCSLTIEGCKLVNRGANEIIPLDPLLEALKLLIVAECAYLLTLLVLKLSIGLFFLRVVTERWQRFVVWTTIGLSILISVTLFFFDLLQCGRFSSMLDYLERRLDGKCVPNTVILGMNYSHAGATALTDWVFIVMPYFILRKSNMRYQDKWIAGSLMVFASISGIASLIRLKYVPALTVETQRFFAEAANIVIWTCVEQGVGIVAGSVMCLRPLFRRYVPSLACRFNIFSHVYINELHCNIAYDAPGRCSSMTKLEIPQQAHVDPRDCLIPYETASSHEPRQPSWPLRANPLPETGGGRDVNIQSTSWIAPGHLVARTGSSQMLPLDNFFSENNQRASHLSELSDFIDRA